MYIAFSVISGHTELLFSALWPYTADFPVISEASQHVSDINSISPKIKGFANLILWNQSPMVKLLPVFSRNHRSLKCCISPLGWKRGEGGGLFCKQHLPDGTNNQRVMLTPCLHT